MANNLMSTKMYLWNLLWPKRLFSPSGGGLEILSIAGINIVRMVSVFKMTMNLKKIGFNIFSANRKVFIPLLLKHLFLEAVVAWVDMTSSFLSRKLAIRLKKKLTEILHQKYFTNQNYYHVEREFSNVDSTMIGDVSTVSSGIANYYSGMCDAGLRGCIFGFLSLQQFISQFGIINGSLLASAPFVHVIFTRWLVEKVSPLDWVAFGTLSEAQGEYRSQQTRLVVHAEAISALRGGAREGSLLQGLRKTIIDLERVLYESFTKHLSWNTAFMNYGLHVTVITIVCGPAVFGRKHRMDLESFRSKRGTLNYQFMLCLQVLVAAWNLSQQMMELNKIEGEGSRIRKLIGVLDKLTATDFSSGGEHFASGDRLAFDSVDVVTPTGNLLVKDLSFSLEAENDSLLLTGHNGAGKSSIFRCLAGLWNVPTGKITKPNANHVYYLPQKPYNVIGTLFDQLAYPDRGGGKGGLTREYAGNILARVGLQYLTERQGVFERDTNWEETLSLGEKQRLAIARLIHHKPKFAILDECTSGVALEMEKKLYFLLSEMEISYITISHRPMLKSLHCKSLVLHGDEAGSFTYKVLRTPDQLKTLLLNKCGAFKTPKKGDTAGLADDRARSAEEVERSVPYEGLPCNREAVPNGGSIVSTLRDVYFVLSNSISYKSVLLAFGILGGTITQSALIVHRGINIQTKMFRAMMMGSRLLFWQSFFQYALNATALSVVDYFSLSWHCSLQIDIYEGVTKKLMDKYISKAGYYSLKTVDGRIQDPETRICDDVQQFAEKITQLQQDLVEPVMKILMFGVSLMKEIGLPGAIMYSYLTAMSVFLNQVMPQYSVLTQAKTKVMGEYKFSQSFTRMHSESIAFFGGGQKEKSVAKKKFERVVDTENLEIWNAFWFGWCKSFFGDRVTGIVSMYLQFTVAEASLGGRAQTTFDRSNALLVSDQQSVIIGVNGQVKDAALAIFNKMDKFGEFIGTVQRLASFQRLLDDQPLPPYMSKEQRLTHAATDGKKRIEVKNLDIVTPAGVCLASNVNVSVDIRHRLQITGPNACGKTSFVRVLSGLWPIYFRGKENSALIDIVGDVSVVPQKMYSVRGTLLDQMTYPSKLETDAVNEEILDRCLDLLKLVGIDYLVERDGGWHVERKFDEVLSLGEQQRLGMARLFYQEPSFAILDECTDAVSTDVERRLYEAAFRRGIVCITVSKRLALSDYHEQELILGAKGQQGYTLRAEK